MTFLKIYVMVGLCLYFLLMVVLRRQMEEAAEKSGIEESPGFHIILAAVVILGWPYFLLSSFK